MKTPVGLIARHAGVCEPSTGLMLRLTFASGSPVTAVPPAPPGDPTKLCPRKTGQSITVTHSLRIFTPFSRPPKGGVKRCSYFIFKLSGYPPPEWFTQEGCLDS